MARALDLDLARLEADWASGAGRASLAASRAEAAAAGVQSTPTLIVGGRGLVGVQPYSQLAAAIAAAAR
jgi:protein-disulfide isomerase